MPLSCFVLDLGGSREISLCLHLPILSNNKIGNSTGDTTCFWFFVVHFPLAYIFSFYVSVSESVRDQSRLSGPESFLNFFTLFPIFLCLQTFLHCTLYVTCRNFRLSHPDCLGQCELSAPYPLLACGNW
jgi:hypothetical protein